MTRTYQAEGIVLKRRPLGEGDRIITFFTKERGKVVALAKGVRKLSSRRAGSLEIGTQAKCYYRQGKTFDLITQTVFITNFQQSRQSLIRITQMQQILEIIDLMTVEDQPAPEVYQILLDTLKALEQPKNQKQLILENIRQILAHLGFTYDKKFTETNLQQYIEQITQRPLRTKKFLIPKTTKQ